MIVIRLRPLVSAAVLLVVVGAVLVIVADVGPGDRDLLADLGLILCAIGIAVSVIAWLERRLTSVESAFIIGAKLADEDARLRSI